MSSDVTSMSNAKYLCFMSRVHLTFLIRLAYRGIIEARLMPNMTRREITAKRRFISVRALNGHRTAIKRKRVVVVTIQLDDMVNIVLRG